MGRLVMLLLAGLLGCFFLPSITYTLRVYAHDLGFRVSALQFEIFSSFILWIYFVGSILAAFCPRPLSKPIANGIPNIRYPCMS